MGLSCSATLRPVLLYEAIVQIILCIKKFIWNVITFILSHSNFYRKRKIRIVSGLNVETILVRSLACGSSAISLFCTFLHFCRDFHFSNLSVTVHPAILKRTTN